ncbi:MAG: hypothetical protein ABI723_18690 [Bacteroidia bacterium]
MKSLKLTLCTLILALITASAIAQSTSISDVVHAPVTSAMLDVFSTSKGFLVPRMLQAEKTAIATPAVGLLIYQTDGAAGFYYYDGTAWIPFTTSDTGWLLNGNSVPSMKTIGTITNYDFPIITNNSERMRVTKTGQVGIGSTAFDLINPERLLVDYGTTTSTTIATFRGSINDYFQINLQNTNDGTSASTDFVATADNGTDSTYYIDMGINSSVYAPGVENFGGPNDGYVYSSSRNLLIGTASANSDIIFLVNGGQLAVNQAMRIDATTKNIIIGRKDGTTGPIGNIVRGPNGSGTNTAGGSLSIIAGNGTGTAAGGALNLNGGTTGTGAAGAVNINAGTNNPININTGTNTQNVTIGGSSNNILFPKFTTVGSVFYTNAVNGQIAATATGTTGQVLTSNGAAAPTWNNPTINIVTLGADVTNNSAVANTIANVTGLSFAVTAGVTYRFHATILYTAAATTTGSRWSISGPATTLLAYNSRYPNSSVGETVYYQVAYDQPAAANTVSPFTTGNIAQIEGIVVPSANGTVTIRFASEIASSAIVAKAGSTLTWW